jgi:hypothetical protein
MKKNINQKIDDTELNNAGIDILKAVEKECEISIKKTNSIVSNKKNISRLSKIDKIDNAREIAWERYKKDEIDNKRINEICCSLDRIRRLEHERLEKEAIIKNYTKKLVYKFWAYEEGKIIEFKDLKGIEYFGKNNENFTITTKSNKKYDNTRVMILSALELKDEYNKVLCEGDIIEQHCTIAYVYYDPNESAFKTINIKKDINKIYLTSDNTYMTNVLGNVFKHAEKVLKKIQMNGDEIDIDGAREMIRYFKLDKPMKTIKNVDIKSITETKTMNKNRYKIRTDILK